MCIRDRHSPALLDAVNPDDHEGIVICERDEQGRGALTSLINHPRYVELVQNGHLGQALTRGELEKRQPSHRPVYYTHLDVYKRQPAATGQRRASCGTADSPCARSASFSACPISGSTNS